MNILLYYQNPHHTVFIESLVEAFVEKGHTVYFLTTCEEGILHSKMKAFGAQIETIVLKGNKLSYHIKHWLYLIKFCKKNKIDVVYSHLQFVNLVAVFAQYFINAKVFPCRHHANDVLLRGNKNALLMDKLINRFAKKIIVVSAAVKNHMIEHEGINEKKITVIPLGYNFELYDKPNIQEVNKIKEQMNCKFLLIVIGRMNLNKRHIVALEVLNKLVKENFDIKMLLLDEGPEKENLKTYISQNNLAEKVLFTGFLANTMNYVEASDLLLQPSISEASNQVVKESGILKKTSIVCKHVGDFDEYILHKQNGFLVSKDDTANEMYTLVKEYYHKKDELEKMGANLKFIVHQKFNIQNISTSYLNLVN